MERADIEHLGTLARIRLNDKEIEVLQAEISDILKYVSAVDEVVAEGALEKKVGAVYNVFREDEVTNEPNQYTDQLLAEMPERKGRFLKVKKILNPDQ